MGVRLPAEYQEVQYIEGTGTQCIVTDINLSTVTNPSVDWTLKVEITAINKTQILAGSDDDFKQIVVLDSNLRYDWCSKSTTKFFYTKFKLGSVFTIMQKDGFLWLDNESHEITTTSTSALKFGLFCKTIKNNAVETYTISNMKLYSFEVKQDFTDIAKYVPCYRKADSKPGIYDLVTKQFFTNAGKGEFTVGPDVIGSISPLMVAWRRMLMKKPELYPVGTNILAKYGAVFVSKHTIDTITGEYVENRSYQASPVYMPISPKYTYWKRGTYPNRAYLSVLAFYDKDKNYISYYWKNDYNDFVIPDIPANARYARIAIPSGSATDVKIIRTA